MRPGEHVDLVATFPAPVPTRVVARRRASVTDAVGEADGLLADRSASWSPSGSRRAGALLGVVAAVDEGRLTVARPSPGAAP